MYEDKTLKCADCGKEFVWSADEQQFFADHGFENEPKRCPECRKSRRHARREAKRAEREMFDIVCEKCGKATQVPFKPDPTRPVYCNDCFQEILAERRAKPADKAEETDPAI